MNGQDKQWVKLWRENTPEIRDRIIGWRKQTAIIKLDHPSRIARAHRLGYKAKQGIIVVRSRVLPIVCPDRSCVRCHMPS